MSTARILMLKGPDLEAIFTPGQLVSLSNGWLQLPNHYSENSADIIIASLPGVLFLMHDNDLTMYRKTGFPLFSGLIQSLPRPLGGSTSRRVCQIAAGNEHVLFLTNDGAVFTPIAQGLHQIQINGNDGDRERIVAIAAGDAHSLFLTEGGEVLSCGANESGQLGRDVLGPTAAEATSSPATIRALTHTCVTKIVCGSRHSVFLDENGYIYTCGTNSYRQCDPEAPTDQSGAARSVPSLVESLVLDELEVLDVFATQFSTICVVNEQRALRVLGLAAWPGAPWTSPSAPVWATDDLIEFGDGSSILKVACGSRACHILVEQNDLQRQIWQFGENWPPTCVNLPPTLNCPSNSCSLTPTKGVKIRSGLERLYIGLNNLAVRFFVLPQGP